MPFISNLDSRDLSSNYSLAYPQYSSNDHLWTTIGSVFPYNSSFSAFSLRISTIDYSIRGNFCIMKHGARQDLRKIVDYEIVSYYIIFAKTSQRRRTSL